MFILRFFIYTVIICCNFIFLHCADLPEFIKDDVYEEISVQSKFIKDIEFIIDPLDVYDTKHYVRIFNLFLSKVGITAGMVIADYELKKINLEEKILNLFFSWGRLETKVSLSLKDTTNPLYKTLVISYKTSDVYRIETININGALSYKPLFLKYVALDVNQRTFCNFFLPSSIFNEEKIKQIPRFLEKFYKDRGFLECSVNLDIIRPHIINDKKGFVNVTIKEGPKYYVNSFNIDVDDVDLYEVMRNTLDGKIVRGDVCCYTYFKKCVSRLSVILKSYGYLKPTIHITYENIGKFDNKDYTNVVIFVRKNIRYRVSKINIYGNNYTQDYTIRRCTTQEEQKWLSYARIKAGKNLIRNHRYGSSVKCSITKSPLNKKGLVDVNYTIKEMEQNLVAVSVAVSSDFKRLQTSHNCIFKNILGTGQGLSFVGNTSPERYNFSINYDNPSFENSKLGFGFNFLYKKELDELGKRYIFDYDGRPTFRSNVFENTVSFDLHSKYYFSKWHQLQAGFGYANHTIKNSYLNIPSGLYVYLKKFGRESYDYSVFIATLFNSMNDSIFPTSGFKHELKFRISFPYKKAFKFYKIDYEFDKFFSIGKRSILHFSGIFGFADIYKIPTSGIYHSFPFFRNYYASNYTDFVRGIPDASIGPYVRDIHKRRFDFGGNMLMRLRTTFFYNFKMLQNYEDTIRTGIFIDIGRITHTRQYFLGSLKLNDFYPKVGLGITIIVKNPLISNCPTQISFSYPLRVTSYADDPQNNWWTLAFGSMY